MSDSSAGAPFPQPGEISLAQNGVLFLDEMPEFKRSVLEVLRQPMEERVITILRACFAIEYPANFMLVAAMNPCPCCYYNHPQQECGCSEGTVQKYLHWINLSAQACNRILKVSRTIENLDGSEGIKTEHLAEAIHYRSLDRENWGS